MDRRADSCLRIPSTTTLHLLGAPTPPASPLCGPIRWTAPNPRRSGRSRYPREQGARSLKEALFPIGFRSIRLTNTHDASLRAEVVQSTVFSFVCRLFGSILDRPLQRRATGQSLVGADLPGLTARTGRSAPITPLRGSALFDLLAHIHDLRAQRRKEIATSHNHACVAHPCAHGDLLRVKHASIRQDAQRLMEPER